MKEILYSLPFIFFKPFSAKLAGAILYCYLYYNP